MNQESRILNVKNTFWKLKKKRNGGDWEKVSIGEFQVEKSKELITLIDWFFFKRDMSLVFYLSLVREDLIYMNFFWSFIQNLFFFYLILFCFVYNYLQKYEKKAYNKLTKNNF